MIRIKYRHAISATITAAVAAVLLSLGCGPSPKVLAQKMNSGDVNTRRQAAKDLRKKLSGKRGNVNLASSVVQACRDPDHDVRVDGFYAIGSVSPHEEGVVAALLDGMLDTSAQVRRAAVASLGDIDPFPSTCLPTLVNLLVDPDEKVRRVAFSAVADREGGAIGSLMRSIDAKDVNLRLAVINVLAQIGAPAKPALTRLRQIANEDENEELRKAAERAVRFISG